MKTVALLGAAHIHTPGFMKRFAERGGVALGYVWDHDRERRERWAAAMKARPIADAAEALRDPAVDAVVVCSETLHHERLVIAAAEAGKPMFVEKPLGMGGADARRMADAIEARQAVFHTGFFQRGFAVNQFIKARIDDGSFGTITRARQSNCHEGALEGWFDTEWRWMTDRAQAGVGAFGDMGAHALDLLMWWLGPVTTATAVVGTAIHRYGCDEYGEGLLRFAGGAAGTLAAGWVDVANPVTTLVSGTHAHAAVVNGQLFFTCKRMSGADGKTPWTDLPSPAPAGYDLYLDWLEGKADTSQFVSARDCAERNQVMERMMAS